ncbi:putative toxin-antitoxin system toxin component, PIN family [Iningainema tapete]|uniref:Putative toxin-antitoxin system toxin component, PIN family n=1 Tax=Iningainema tapete BLCC-T55 TaxID=2748662 RepID=A0A8J6XTT9_9CYAN|nr:putative toxin-antitoxin system toxin component, PIN family [Iningainema tapete]MBD2778339.1 putative toxin-antitoxin system toxin component, PIN family [Iningainema tapete BLCC-T55]
MKGLCVISVDTNILFSGLGWRGSPFRCLELARNGQVVSVTCQEILAELKEKLQLKQKMSVTEAAQDVAKILSFSRLVTIDNTLEIVVNDPDDDMVLECAVVGGASHIVTGDRHLLSLNSYQDIAIVSAVQSQTTLAHLMNQGCLYAIAIYYMRHLTITTYDRSDEGFRLPSVETKWRKRQKLHIVNALY